MDDGSDLTKEEVNVRSLDLHKKMAKHVTLIAFCEDRSNPAGVFDSGTGSLVELPLAGECIVTNWHVWDAFREHRLLNRPCVLSITGTGIVRPIDISDAVLVSEDRDLDLAVLRYPPERIEQVGKTFYQFAVWPPQRAAAKERVIVVGYPGKRSKVVEGMYYHESALLGTTVEDASERQIRYSFANAPEVVQHSQDSVDTFSWGGLSGSMVYRLDEEENTIRPCGIHHSGGDGLQGVFLATHFNFIQADGSIVFRAPSRDDGTPDAATT